jgi:hypothetical protein
VKITEMKRKIHCILDVLEELRDENQHLRRSLESLKRQEYVSSPRKDYSQIIVG